MMSLLWLSNRLSQVLQADSYNQCLIRTACDGGNSSVSSKFPSKNLRLPQRHVESDSENEEYGEFDYTQFHVSGSLTSVVGVTHAALHISSFASSQSIFIGRFIKNSSSIDVEVYGR